MLAIPWWYMTAWTSRAQPMKDNSSRKCLKKCIKLVLWFKCSYFKNYFLICYTVPLLCNSGFILCWHEHFKKRRPVSGSLETHSPLGQCIWVNDRWTGQHRDTQGPKNALFLCVTGPAQLHSSHLSSSSLITLSTSIYITMNHFEVVLKSVWNFYNFFTCFCYVSALRVFYSCCNILQII
jgi:hypothetical protein